MQSPRSHLVYSPLSDRKVTGSRPSSPVGFDDASMSGDSPPPPPPPFPSKSDSIPRKRTISRISMDNLPPLPPIEGELMLEVYTHDTLNSKSGAITTDEHGGSARLAVLGEKVLESAVMTNLFRRRPMNSANQLKELIKDYTDKAAVDQWTTGYNLRSKLRCAPGFATRVKSAEEGRALFLSYVGALCIQSGYNVVQDWINQLLEPSEKRVKGEPPALTLPSPLPQQVGAPPNVAAASHARFLNQFNKSDTPTFSQPSPRLNQSPFLPGNNNPFSNAGGFFPRPTGTPLQRSQPPPPTTKPPPLPPTPNQQVSYLPLFNQTASQRRLGVEYTALFQGPPHAGKWYVKCLVNSVEKGEGSGLSKQLAKEEAAKQAFYAMGWSA